MAYADYTIRVIARAIAIKADARLGTPEELVLVYPEAERGLILTEVYRMRSDLEPVE